MRILSVAAFSFAISGCVTGYQAYTWSGGYKDKSLGDGKYYVEYLGNGSTSTELVLQRWEQRSSELCPNGYEIISNSAGENSGTTAGMVGTTVIPISFSHPYIQGEIQCKN